MEETLSVIEGLSSSPPKFDGNTVSKTVSSIICQTEIPKFEQSEDAPYSKEDFIGVPEKAEQNLQYLDKLLECLEALNGKGYYDLMFMKTITLKCVLICGEFSDENQYWVSQKCAKLSKHIMETLCQIYGCKLPCEILTRTHTNQIGQKSEAVNDVNNPNLLVPVMQNLSCKLNKKEWKKYPSCKSIYWWILQQLYHEQLGDHLAYLLPPALFITDDWEVCHKVFGLKCLQHIVNNAPGGDFRMFGRAEVVQDALNPLLYSREPDVLEILYPVALKVATLLDEDPRDRNGLKAETHLDVVAQALLRDMAYEHKILLRTIYANALPQVLLAQGVGAIRWSKDVISICADYLATIDDSKESSRLNILRALQTYIQKCWPMIHLDAEKILNSIVCLVYDVTLPDSSVEEKYQKALLAEVELVFKLLYAAAPSTVQRLCLGLDSLATHAKCQQFLKKLINYISSQEEEMKNAK
ncbi:TELO2-interacting protein 2-like [Oratosquilla oratoria]|uniref:TELO2-interacting protein 2-like n=1 Tax=Oratosquilla oratoria TaxID=337810 RepID=UPI003F758433